MAGMDDAADDVRAGTPGPPGALVLHEDARMRAHVLRLVAAEGFDAHAADSPWALVAPQQPEPGLYVLAVTALEDRDLDAVTLVRARRPDAFVLLLFPANHRERAGRALVLGADAALLEPFYPDELSALARRALARLGEAPLRAHAAPVRAAPVHAEPVSAEPETPRPARAPRGDVTPAPARVAPPASPRRDHDDPTPVEQLAVGVAHSVRNPLQIVELLLATAEAGEEPLDLAAVRQQLARIAGVVADLTRFGSGSRAEPVEIDANALVRSVFAPPRRRGDPRFGLELAPGELPVRAVPDELRAALELVRERAVRVTPRGESVAVATRADATGIEIAVSDGGRPLSDEELARFFQPTPRVDAVQAGTWLEMAACAGIVRHHGGSCTVVPGPDAGATVVVRLPRAGGDAAR